MLSPTRYIALRVRMERTTSGPNVIFAWEQIRPMTRSREAPKRQLFTVALEIATLRLHNGLYPAFVVSSPVCADGCADGTWAVGRWADGVTITSKRIPVQRAKSVIDVQHARSLEELARPLVCPRI